MHDTSSSVNVPDAVAFRRALSRVPTSVVVVATLVDHKPVGMLVGTFTSVSVHPLLVGYLGERTSRTLPYLLGADYLSFSVVRESDLETVQMLRRPMEKRFDGLAWETDGDLPVPVLPGAPLTVFGRPHAAFDAGDHIFSLIQVLGVRVNGPSRPLVFCSGRLTRMDPSNLVGGDIWQLGWHD